MIFKCQYINHYGRLKTTVLDCDTKQQAFEILKRKRFTPISIQARSSGKEKTAVEKKTLSIFGKSKRIKTKELVFFFYNLSTMLESGVPIDMAVALSSKQMKTASSKLILMEIVNDVKRGFSLSESIDKSNAFPELVSSIVRSGEESGNLEESFRYLSDYYEKQAEIKAKVTGAMIYPTMVVLATFVAVYFISTSVLPNILSVVTATGGELSFATKTLVFLSDTFTKLGILSLLIPLVVPAVIFYVFKKQDKYKMDELILKIPLFGSLIKLNSSIQFTTTLYILLSSGVTINRGLEIASDVISNLYIKGQIEQIKKGIIRGESLSANMRVDIFGEVTCNIVQVGEKTGSLAEPLGKAAKFLTVQMNDSTKKLTEMLTPAVMVVIALIVGFIVIGTLQPMFSIYGS